MFLKRYKINKMQLILTKAELGVTIKSITIFLREEEL